MVLPPRTAWGGRKVLDGPPQSGLFAPAEAFEPLLHPNLHSIYGATADYSKP